MRIAFFGGSFDPPHLGHTGIALAAAERLRLDRVLMAPTGRQPLKEGQRAAPYADRLAMVELACRHHPPLEPSRLDAPRPDGGFNYTYDVLRQLATLQPQDERFCLVGADSLETLPRWHRAAEALLLAEWIVAARPGFPLETLAALLPAGVTAAAPEAVSDALVRVPLTGGGGTGSLWLLPGLQYEISATRLRAALADGDRGIAQNVLDPAVAAYARSHALYETAGEIR